MDRTSLTQRIPALLTLGGPVMARIERIVTDVLAAYRPNPRAGGDQDEGEVNTSIGLVA
jgi:hypothetical protein